MKKVKIGQKEEQTKVYILIAEHHKAFSVCNKIGLWSQVAVNMQLCDKIPFIFIHIQSR